MEGDLGTVVLVLVALVAWGGFLYVFIQRAESLLNKWAHENQYQLLRREVRLFRKGPFFWSGRAQVVYRVEVCDQEGWERKGWVRCGTWWSGVLADAVEVKWDA